MSVHELGDYADWGVLALGIAVGIAVGIISIVHGWPKLTGARGMAQAFGRTDTGTVAFFTAQGAVETLGGVRLIAGIWTQPVNVAPAAATTGGAR